MLRLGITALKASSRKEVLMDSRLQQHPSYFGLFQSGLPLLYIVHEHVRGPHLDVRLHPVSMHSLIV